MSDVIDSPATSATPPSRKRRAILDAAALLFCARARCGVHGRGGEGGGVSKATLYAHFTGKDALFADIVAERLPRSGPRPRRCPA